MGLQIWPDRATASSRCVLDLQKLTRLSQLQHFSGQLVKAPYVMTPLMAAAISA